MREALTLSVAVLHERGYPVFPFTTLRAIISVLSYQIHNSFYSSIRHWSDHLNVIRAAFKLCKVRTHPDGANGKSLSAVLESDISRMPGNVR